MKARILELLRCWLSGSAAVALVLLTTACVDPKVPPYSLTAPSAVETSVPPPPVAPVVAPLTIAVSASPPSPFRHRPAALIASVQHLDGPATFTWTFGDGDTLITTTDLARHTYQTEGDRLASVRVTDATGRTADATIQITIRAEPVPPAAPTPPTPSPGTPSLSATLTCTVSTTRGLEARCNLTTSYSGSPQPVVVTRVDWDFGDGTTQSVLTSPVVTHAYAQAGSYAIFANVWATTAEGTSATATAADSVVIP